jgi:hypothetical protein
VFYLNGRRFDAPQRGLNIIDGKKIIVNSFGGDKN